MAQDNGSNSIAAPILLLIAAALGFIISNSPLSDYYFQALGSRIDVFFDNYKLFGKSISLIINDGLMSVFFLFIGLELKRALIVGELSSPEKSLLPIVSAVGGMVIPALIYFFFNFKSDGISGWGIPMATDIAFALGILSMFGSRVPAVLKVTLAAIAIVDDLGAILVIAIFYTSQIGYTELLIVLGIFLVCFALNRWGVTRLSVYLLLWVPMWYFMLKSGVHTTITGVLLAACIPLAHKNHKSRAKLISDILENKASPLDSPAVFLEKSLLRWVNFLIIPIFAFANSGVQLGSIQFGTVSFGVVFGLVVGKPLGVAGFAWIAHKLKLLNLPQGMTWGHLLGIGFFAGIGFTMSLFINSLAFPEAPLLANEAKFAILFASGISAFFGTVFLLRHKKAQA